MALSRHIARFGAQAVAGMAKLAMPADIGQKLLYTLGGGVAVGLPTFALTRLHAAKERDQARNMGFGAGVATGIAAPRIIQGLYDAARGAGIVPPQQVAA